MDGGLKALLEKHAIHTSIVEKIGDLKASTLGHFASLMDSRSECKTLLVGTAMEHDLGQLARLKSAWREADAIYKKVEAHSRGPQ